MLAKSCFFGGYIAIVAWWFLKFVSTPTFASAVSLVGNNSFPTAKVNLKWMRFFLSMWFCWVRFLQGHGLELGCSRDRKFRMQQFWGQSF